MWAFKSLVGQGPDLRGLPGALVLHALRDTAVRNRNQDGRHLPAAAGPGRHRVAAGAVGRSGAGRRAGAGLDDDPVDPAVQPRRGGEPRRRVRRRASRAGRAVRRAGTCWRRRGSPRTRGSSARSPRCWPRYTGAQLVGTAYTAALRLLRRAATNAHQVLAADYVTTEDGTGVVHIAPAFGEEDKAVTDAAGIEVVNPVDSQGKFTVAGPAVRGLPRVRRQHPDHGRPQGGRAAGPPGQLRAPVSALLAVRHPADPACGVVVVRRGDEVPRPDGRAEPADHLGAGAHQGRAVRQVAGRCSGLVDLAEPVLGIADPGVGLGRPGVPAGRRLRLARRAGARLRCAARRICTGRTSTS